MARQRVFEDRTISQTEANRRFQDSAASIDSELEEAWKSIDWKRRNEAETSLVKFINTYLIGLTLDEPPSLKGEEVLNQMQNAITSHSNFAIALHRGAGKTAFIISTAVYALLTGLQKFIVVICNNQRASNGILNDIFRVFQVPDSDLAHDYPEIILPYTISQGSYRRRQLFKGMMTNIKKNANELFLPTYDDERFSRASGSLVVTRSITSGLRGIRNGTMRPTFAMIDDIQTSESAQNPEAVQKLIDIIRSDVIPLAGKTRLSILQTFTPIAPEDLVQKTREDKSWTTTVYPAIMSYPQDTEMWKKYFQMFDDENVLQKDHSESLEFYRSNKEKMDFGSEVFNKSRYSEKDGHISMIQKLLELKHQIGEASFDAEYQMNPRQMQFALNITPSIVASRQSNLSRLEIPESNVALVVASSDLNLSKYITTTVTVFMRDQTACIVWHKFRRCRIPMNIPEQDYYQRTYNLLAEHGKELSGLGVKINAWAIDANGVPFNSVCDFCKNSAKICGIPAAGFIGKASHAYTPFSKSRLKEDVNQTLLCGNAEEHLKAGSGRQWTFFNSDFYHELAQKSFLQEVGNLGSLSLYRGGEHAEFAIQVCAEKLVMKRQRQDGRFEYQWKDSGDHDALDSIGQALAAFASFGFSTQASGKTVLTAHKKKFRPKLRIV